MQLLLNVWISGAAGKGLAMALSADWLDRAGGRGGPIYLGIVDALAEAVRAGDLQPGDRLPPQRQVAARLGVDLTTVTRAYSIARERGLVDGAVGRGTFVRTPAEDADEAGAVDLTMNLPPPPHGLALGRLLAETSAAILAHADAAILMGYHPGFGATGQRAAGARWLAPALGQVAPDRVLVAPGAQAALAAVLSMLRRRGDALVVEPLTYPGAIGLARHLGLRLVVCPTDEAGPVPEALDEVCARERPAAIYLVPTLQNPTTTTTTPARRGEIARIARAREAWIVEDDPYARLLDHPAPAIAALAPERTFHVATLAKTLSPGLRIAYLVCPPDWAERAADALRALAQMPPPLMAAVATRWIQEGAAEAVLAGVRTEARARREIARRLLPQALGAPESLHVWLPLAGEAASQRLRAEGQARGMALVTAEAFCAGPEAGAGLRLSLGGPARRAVLERALGALAGLVADPPAPRSGVV